MKKQKGVFSRILDSVTRDFTVLRSELVKMQEHYERHAAEQYKRADRATAGSNIQNEILRSAAFNRGRAAAIKEVLAMLEDEVLSDE